MRPSLVLKVILLNATLLAILTALFILPNVTLAKPVCTDRATFIKDVTIPDKSKVNTDKMFDKVWRLKNSGTCTWTSSYSVVFIEGDQLEAPKTQNLQQSVAPGETVDIKLKMTAPSSDGPYKGQWKLENTEGLIFGVGSKADQSFWVEIIVKRVGSFTYEERNGENINNSTLRGTPKATRIDKKIDFKWSKRGPRAVEPDDSYSIRWTGTPNIPAGIYQFRLSADDGARLWVENVLVIDRWANGTERKVEDMGLGKGNPSEGNTYRQLMGSF